MTTPEHTLVGIHVALSCGFHRVLGWRSVVLAGLASNMPDWDGLPMLIDMQRFEAGHRVWGHCLISLLLMSLILGSLQWTFDGIGSVTRWFSDRFSVSAWKAAIEQRQSTTWRTWMGLIGIALLVQVLHLPCDMVVSGGNGLSDWAVQPWWPFSRAAYVFPLIPWGDVGPTVILMVGIIAVAKQPSRMSTLSLLTLFLLCAYLLLRGWSRGLF